MLLSVTGWGGGGDQLPTHPPRLSSTWQSPHAFVTVRCRWLMVSRLAWLVTPAEDGAIFKIGNSCENAALRFRSWTGTTYNLTRPHGPPARGHLENLKTSGKFPFGYKPAAPPKYFPWILPAFVSEQTQTIYVARCTTADKSLNSPIAAMLCGRSTNKG
ncbi:hypothetical protein BaRGS_00004561 [Batillaria attramentaria]|uniref:Uncharacterized protein n=1 Tax=Batillaria attramentaria TaxID=370345 RepID=A0ABD0LXP3_9CAEN